MDEDTAGTSQEGDQRGQKREWPFEEEDFSTCPRLVEPVDEALLALRLEEMEVADEDSDDESWCDDEDDEDEEEDEEEPENAEELCAEARDIIDWLTITDEDWEEGTRPITRQEIKEHELQMELRKRAQALEERKLELQSMPRFRDLSASTSFCRRPSPETFSRHLDTSGRRELVSKKLQQAMDEDIGDVLRARCKHEMARLTSENPFRAIRLEELTDAMKNQKWNAHFSREGLEKIQKIHDVEFALIREEQAKHAEEAEDADDEEDD